MLQASGALPERDRQAACAFPWLHHGLISSAPLAQKRIPLVSPRANLRCASGARWLGCAPMAQQRSDRQFSNWLSSYESPIIGHDYPISYRTIMANYFSLANRSEIAFNSSVNETITGFQSSVSST
ncbi:MAG: hypothetical protein HY231_12260 [Acidobacteria bacterium]|nr:hypothetical protein [Acidobacteriota bacterium]